MADKYQLLILTAPVVSARSAPEKIGGLFTWAHDTNVILYHCPPLYLDPPPWTSWTFQESPTDPF